jgi:ABC-type branched-subunit amino acid transport system ATPase component
MVLRGESGPAVEVEGLEKRYPKAPVNAVDGVTFTVERGEVFGLLGPNGAGKTTTIGVSPRSASGASSAARSTDRPANGHSPTAASIPSAAVRFAPIRRARPGTAMMIAKPTSSQAPTTHGNQLNGYTWSTAFR